jgi:rubrerythrin
MMIKGKEGLQEAMVEAFSLEKGMREFYRYAESKANSDEARATFKELRYWEDRHMQYIESLYQALMGDRELDSYEAFSQRVPSDRVESGIPLREAENLFDTKKPDSEIEIITLALEMEGKAYNFYRRFSESAEDTNAQVVFKELMMQEKKHIDALIALKQSIGT